MPAVAVAWNGLGRGKRRQERKVGAPRARLAQLGGLASSVVDQGALRRYGSEDQILVDFAPTPRVLEAQRGPLFPEGYCWSRQIARRRREIALA